MKRNRVDYGLDAPGLVKFFVLFGGALTALSYWIQHLNPQSRVLVFIGSTASMGPWWIATGALMIWSSYFGKFRARDRLISSLTLQGNETVLDVGCGRGLILLGVAKALPHGKGLGVDLWSQKDLSSNSKDALLKNAEIEGVRSRIEIHDGDMRKLPFANGSMDAVTASMSIHNIPTQEGRREAIHEIARVLKPGGKIALLDFRSTAEYVAFAKEAGLTEVRRSGVSFWNFPPSRTVFGKKPIPTES